MSRFEMQHPLIFDIKRYAINDGPGIRTTIFFKGCPLACLWCHNPESIAPQMQKLFTVAKCIGCGECVEVCLKQACELTAAGIETDSQLCNLCGKCAEVCPAKATEMSGHYASVADLLQVIERERPFFDQSGGGITFSGGEPLLYPEFLCELLDACGERGIHRAVDTSGLVKKEVLLQVAARTDLFLFDLKLMDSEKHKEWTGVGNITILANLRTLAKTGVAIQIRVPLIGGVNDDDGNIEATAVFVAGLTGEKRPVNLLPYHAVGRGKDDKLGQIRDFDAMHEPTVDDLDRIVETFAEHGLEATVGG
jgi:pyruvate formate lyase activating enzyme